MAISSQKKTVMKVDYEAGLLTKSEVAAKHQINRSTLSRIASREGWEFSSESGNMFFEMKQNPFFQQRLTFGKSNYSRYNILKKYHLARLEILKISEQIPGASIEELKTLERKAESAKSRMILLTKTGRWVSHEKQKEIKERRKKLLIDRLTLRIRNAVSNRVNKRISKNGASTTTILDKILGYSVQDLIDHLEAQFNNKMTWSNYGEYWHIDHIIPISWFWYDSIEHPQFKDCWSLDNLQPLEATKNMSKGNRFIG